MDVNRFDYIIIGNGLAGLQLALAMATDHYFDSKSIVLIDPTKKEHNDKTWCFWEIGEGKWDPIITKSWSKTHFATANKNTSFSLEPYTYKMLRSVDFYGYALAQLKSKSNIHFLTDEVISAENLKLTTKQNAEIFANIHLFDSRIPEDYYKKDDDHIRIYQHFKGWIIETEEDHFDPEVFTTMDYRIKHNNDTTFTYILPLTSRKALVEFTYFTPYMVEDHVYDDHLNAYIREILNIEQFKITETEQGIIPMTNFPFSDFNSAHCTKIGTAGGWVKGSTGYSFKHTEKKVAKIISNIKNGKRPDYKLFEKKYRFYDTIFLKVLHDNNSKGEWIFEQFYTKNNTLTMFRFLDEESSFKEDLTIMTSLMSSAFIKAFFKTI